MVDPYDEEEIENSDALIRRIDPDWHLSWDHDRGCNRISSKAFQASTKLNSGMSVDIEKLITSAGLNPKQYVTTPKYRGSVSFIAEVARDLGLRVGYEPVEKTEETDANPYHGEVWGPADKPYKFTKSQQKTIHAEVDWYVELEDVAIR